MAGLTPLGTRVLEGFKKQWGKQGEAKFNKAMTDGVIDRTKMQTDPLHGGPDQGQLIEHTSESAPRAEPAPAPHGLARTATGAFQNRPG